MFQVKSYKILLGNTTQAFHNRINDQSVCDIIILSQVKKHDYLCVRSYRRNHLPCTKFYANRMRTICHNYKKTINHYYKSPTHESQTNDKIKIHLTLSKRCYLHFFSVNWCSRHDLPTPISPIIIYLNMQEQLYGPAAIFMVLF